MADKIFDVMVPKEKQIQIKNGKRKVVDAKIFQGYVLVEMKLTDETWYIVRNTPGVTGQRNYQDQKAHGRRRAKASD